MAGEIWPKMLRQVA